MTRESLARAHSPWLPLHKAARPGPVTSALSWSTGCVMLRRGNHPCVLGQICGQTHYGHVSIMFVWGTALTAFLCLEQHRLPLSFEPGAPQRADVKCVSARKLILETRGFVGEFLRDGKPSVFFCFFFQRTCARHLERIGVGAIVAVTANAVNGAFAGGAAVDGTLQAGFIPLGRFEEAGRAG